MATNKQIQELQLLFTAKSDQFDAKLNTIEKKLNFMQKRTEGFMEKLQNKAKDLQGVMMSVGLSFLFTGMAIKNFTQGLLMSLYETYSSIRGESDPLVNEMNKITARVNSLKDRLISAADEQGVFDKWFGVFDRIMTKLEELDNEQLADFIDNLIELTITGAKMMIVGQAILFGLGLISLGMWLLNNPMIILSSVIIALGFIAYNADNWSDKFSAIALAISLVAIAFLISGSIIIASILAVIVLIIAFIGIMIYYWEGFGDEIIYATKTIGDRLVTRIKVLFELLKGAWDFGITGLKYLWEKFLDWITMGARVSKAVEFKTKMDDIEWETYSKQQELLIGLEEREYQRRVDYINSKNNNTEEEEVSSLESMILKFIEKSSGTSDGGSKVTNIDTINIDGTSYTQEDLLKLMQGEMNFTGLVNNGTTNE